MMNNFITIFISILSFVANIYGAYPLFGRCTRQPVIEDFNITKYTGIWYETDRYFSFGDWNARCTTIKYNLDLSPSRESNLLKFTKKSLLNSKSMKGLQKGTLSFSSNKKSGHLQATLIKDGTKSEEETNPYWILDTDYENYSVVWSCKNSGLLSFQSAVVLTRQRDPSNLIRGSAYGAMKSHNLMTKFLVRVDQEDCPDLFSTPIPIAHTNQLALERAYVTGKIRRKLKKPKLNKSQ